MGDFNFAEFDIDKGKGMDSRDKFIKPLWDNFLSTSAIIDPSECNALGNEFSHFPQPRVKVGAIGYM